MKMRVKEKSSSVYHYRIHNSLFNGGMSQKIFEL